MCGIIGYIGREDCLPFLMDGLRKLEYRGYDSAGIAVINNAVNTGADGGKSNNINNGAITAVKAEGRLDSLQDALSKHKAIDGKVGIGHTRWATHGKPSEENSHPHLSRTGLFAVVHNGIIENYLELKEFLTDRSFKFLSQTDTEVVGHLLEYYYRGDILSAIAKTTQRLKGAYALAILCAGDPETIYAVRKANPLVIGVFDSTDKDLHTDKTGGAARCKPQKGMLASDMSALISYTKKFIFPDEGEIALVKNDSVKVVNLNFEPVEKEIFTADWDGTAAEKDGYAHFMLKEIFQQPKAVSDTLAALNKKLGALRTLDNVQKVNIIACGSSYHAGCAAKYFIEKTAAVPVECHMASEYRYQTQLPVPNTLTIAITQSGETADTRAAAEEAKKHSRVLSIVNVPGSSITRESDEVVFTCAGPEISVATTKGYLTQVIALYMLGLELAKRKAAAFDGRQGSNAGLLFDNEKAVLQDLNLIPDSVKEILKNEAVLQKLASRFSSINHAFFIGRGIDYAIGLEGALKLKEISYIHAQGYAAGELKHGTISLIENGSLVVAVSTDGGLKEKMLSNIKEVQSRGAAVLAVSPFDDILNQADHQIKIQGGTGAPVLAAVSLQLFAYYVALARGGCDIDKPRNLAKAVTVE